MATVVRNASTQEIFGVELEMNFQITQNWSLRASYGYIDAEYDNYIADITGDGIITDNSNLIPRNTPENTFGVITTYDANIGQGLCKPPSPIVTAIRLKLRPATHPSATWTALMTSAVVSATCGQTIAIASPSMAKT